MHQSSAAIGRKNRRFGCLCSWKQPCCSFQFDFHSSQSSAVDCGTFTRQQSTKQSRYCGGSRQRQHGKQNKNSFYYCLKIKVQLWNINLRWFFSWFSGLFCFVYWIFWPKKQLRVVSHLTPPTHTHTSKHKHTDFHHYSWICRLVDENSFHCCHPFVLTRATRSCRRRHEPYQPRHEGSREKFKRFREMLWAFHMSM